MVNTALAHPMSEQISSKRLLWAGPVTIVTAMVANTLVRYVAAATLQPDPRFVPLGPVTPAVFSLFGVLGAVILLAVVGRYSRRPLWLFQRIVLIALPITWVPDILVLVTGAIPGANPATVLVLMLMHVVAVAIILTLLTRLVRE
jgi:hypothetical protein